MQKAFDYMEQHHMIGAQDKVIVGVSGGADSLCLLFVLRAYQSRVPFTLLAVHVEHGIRGEESRQDARFVEELCGRLQVEYRCVSCDAPALAKSRKISLEDAARALRYEAFERVRQETGANRIAVAHNRDDQAETILFQISRGSGLAGAGGMRPVRGSIIRPLLACSRAEIEEYLLARKIGWRTDSTNLSAEFSRNCLRHRVIPLLKQEINGAADVHLAALGEELQDVWEYIAEQADRAAERIAVRGDGRVSIDAAGLAREESFLQPYIVRACLQKAGCSLKNIGRNHIRSILALFAGQSGRETALPGGWRARREFDRVLLFSETERRSGQEPLLMQEARVPGVCTLGEHTFVFRLFPNENQIILQKTYTKWLDYDKIKDNFFIRTRRAGDYITVNREGGKKKLKAYFIEEKIPVSERDTVPLLACGSEILWVVGHRINEAYKVSPETKRILEVQMIGGHYGRENNSADPGGRSEPQN